MRAKVFTVLNGFAVIALAGRLFLAFDAQRHTKWFTAGLNSRRDSFSAK